ncbi:ABC transporter permease [Nocardioides pacificus]
MTGTWVFLRAFLRRDRWMLVWWSLGGMLLYWSQGISVEGLYASQAEFDQAAASMEGNAGFIAMAGPARALNTVGGQVTWQSAAFGAIVAGLMSMFLVARHTRAEEESGRDEVLRAAAVGRFATTTAALLTALVANVLLGALIAVSLVVAPLHLAVEDSLALGVGAALSGAVFTGVALVAAQLTTTTRGMYGLTGAVIGLAYGLRAVGDLGNPALSWLSPIGWYQAMHPFSGVRWWPALLLLGAAMASVAAAYAVFVRRDFGSGVLAARPGPARAAGGLASGPGLAWRLQRGTVLGWVLGIAVTGVAYGTLGRDVEDLVGESEAARELFLQGGGSITDAFYATMILMVALMTCGFTISSALRPHGEEDAGRVDSLLATALPRWSWLLGHVLVTIGGTLVVLVAGGAGMGVGYALVTGETDALGDFVLPLTGYLAPVLVLSGLARAIHGLAPRLSVVAWLGLLYAFVVMMFGEILRMPSWLQHVSPFEHLALVPAESFAWLPFLSLLGIAAALSAVGQVGFARRDLR